MVYFDTLDQQTLCHQVILKRSFDFFIVLVLVQIADKNTETYKKKINKAYEIISTAQRPHIAHIKRTLSCLHTMV